MVFTLPTQRNMVRLIDVAVCHCLATYNLNVPARIGPNAAATAYEAVKEATYGDKIRAERPDAILVPIIFDTFAGLSTTGAAAIRTMCEFKARGLHQPLVTVMRHQFHRLNFLIVEKCAQVASLNGFAVA